MPIIIKRKEMTWMERIYIPAVGAGFIITIRHFLRNLKSVLFQKKATATMQYPEEKWKVPTGYRGAPTLVRDQDEREKCVGCQLCEFVCPPRAITITPGELPSSSNHKKVEKFAQEFKIDMLRCIYCGLCEEVCPERAIILREDYAFTGLQRKDMVHDKKRLLELGGVLHDDIMKWNHK